MSFLDTINLPLSLANIFWQAHLFMLFVTLYVFVLIQVLFGLYIESRGDLPEGTLAGVQMCNVPLNSEKPLFAPLNFGSLICK